MNLKLIPLAMIICDTVITDTKTHKKSLIGLFNRINAPKVPTRHAGFFIYLALTEGRGRYRSQIRCLHADDNSVVFKAEGDIVFKGPMQVLDVVFDLSGLSFPKYGDYRFEFDCGEEPLISRKFTVARPSRPRKKQE